MNYVDDCGTDLKYFRLGNLRCPGAFIIIAADRGYRSERRELPEDSRVADISRVNDVVGARKRGYRFGPKKAVSV
jgi:hypothetical protein